MTNDSHTATSAGSVKDRIFEYRDVQYFAKLVGSPFAPHELERIAEYIQRTLGIPDALNADFLQHVEGLTGADLATLNNYAHDWSAALWTLVDSHDGTGWDSPAMVWFLDREAEVLAESVDLLNQCALELITGRRGVSVPSWLITRWVACDLHYRPSPTDIALERATSTDGVLR